MTLRDLLARLDCSSLRYVGDPQLVCRGTAVLVGAPGGRMQIQMLGHDQVDVLICGEINEWEISEYALDAFQQGKGKALIVVGHAVSEEAGMAGITPWLQSLLPGIPVTFIPGGRRFERGG